MKTENQALTSKVFKLQEQLEVARKNKSFENVDCTVTHEGEKASDDVLVDKEKSIENDPNICDAVCMVGEGNTQEETPAPSQFLAVSSPYFNDKKRVI